MGHFLVYSRCKAAAVAAAANSGMQEQAAHPNRVHGIELEQIDNVSYMYYTNRSKINYSCTNTHVT